MVTIISNPIKKILKLFCENFENKIHLREICRKTELNENTVSKILFRLYEENLLDYERRGNLKEYFLKNNKKSRAILSLLNSEKFEEIPNIRKKTIEIYMESLEEMPIIILLFGSTAKKNSTSNSDIDLFLIVNKEINDKKAKDYSESQTGIDINSFQITLKDFELDLQLKKDKVLQSAIKSGYPITNSELFYKKLLK